MTQDIEALREQNKNRLIAGALEHLKLEGIDSATIPLDAARMIAIGTPEGIRQLLPAQALPGIDLDSLQRYDVLALTDGGGNCHFIKSEQGAYVAYSDAASLIAQARAARPKRQMPPEMKAAIEEAHKTGATSALLQDGSAVFINYGHDFGDNDHLCCTACGGSGHIEDQQARAAQAAVPVAEIPPPLRHGYVNFETLDYVVGFVNDTVPEGYYPITILTDQLRAAASQAAPAQPAGVASERDMAIAQAVRQACCACADAGGIADDVREAIGDINLSSIIRRFSTPTITAADTTVTPVAAPTASPSIDTPEFQRLLDDLEIACSYRDDSTRMRERYDNCRKIFVTYIDSRATLVPVAAQQADEGVMLHLSRELVAALKRLSFAAQTTGGTAGPDAELQAAIAQAEQALSLGAVARAMNASEAAPVAAQQAAVHITPQEAAAAGIECGDTACAGCMSGEGWCINDGSNPYAADSWDEQAAAVAAPSLTHVGTLTLYEDKEAAFGYAYDISTNMAGHEALQSMDGYKLYAAPATAAAATTSENARDAALYRWLRDQAIYQQEVSDGWYEIKVEAPLQDDVEVTAEQFDMQVRAAMRATQQEGE